MHTLYFSSSFDDEIAANISAEEKQLGKSKEERWKTVVDEIWRSSCFKNYKFINNLPEETPVLNSGNEPTENVNNEPPAGPD